MMMKDLPGRVIKKLDGLPPRPLRPNLLATERRVLDVVKRGQCIQTEIARKAHVSESGTKIILLRLENRGLVRKEMVEPEFQRDRGIRWYANGGE